MSDGARIVTISSNATVTRVPGLSLYAGSKAAVEAFTRTWAIELASRRILVNCVSPGMIDTNMIREICRPVRSKRSKPATLNRVAHADDIASVVAFLCGPDSGWINGQVVVANGGS